MSVWLTLRWPITIPVRIRWTGRLRIYETRDPDMWNQDQQLTNSWPSVRKLSNWLLDQLNLRPFWHLANWALETLGIWNLGGLGIWEFGHLDTWVFGHLDIWTFGHLGVWTLGHLGIWTLGHLGIWTLGHFELHEPWILYWQPLKPGYNQTWVSEIKTSTLSFEEWWIPVSLIVRSWGQHVRISWKPQHPRSKCSSASNCETLKF